MSNKTEIDPDISDEAKMICNGCGGEFMPNGLTNYYGSADSDETCSPFTPMVGYCTSCWAELGEKA